MHKLEGIELRINAARSDLLAALTHLYAEPADETLAMGHVAAARVQLDKVWTLLNGPADLQDDEDGL